MKIYLGYSTDCHTTREPTSGDDWDNGDSHTDWSFGSAWVESADIRYRAMSVETGYTLKAGDTVYLVVAVWSTGSTFGHEHGSNAEIMEVFTTKPKADWWAKTLESEPRLLISHVPWYGYFESLCYIEVVERILRG